MGLRVYIFDTDLSLHKLLAILLKTKGHQVQELAGPCNNFLIHTENTPCPSDTSCADAIIVSTSPPVHKYIQQLVHQTHNGCKIPKQNIAVLTTSSTEGQRTAIQEMGFSVIKKPFKLSEIEEWLETCAKRLNKTS